MFVIVLPVAMFFPSHPSLLMTHLTKFQASSRMLENDFEHSVVVPKMTIDRLRRFALQRLQEIVQSRSVDDQHWASSRSELIAAKALLNRFQST
jgi:hypothetical protein